jgi:hypothetical protein
MFLKKNAINEKKKASIFGIKKQDILFLSAFI